jgi:hypothetical protein
MRRPGHLAASLAVSAILASAFPAPAAAQRVEVGNAATVVGDVKMSNSAIRTPRAIQRRQHLAWGDRIDTGKKSQLQILLLDRSTFGIGASSRVQIDRFVYDPNAGRSVVATFFKGALRFFSGRQEGENSADITTPAGRIGIRGTALDLLVGEEAKEIATDEDFVDDTRGVDSKEDEATLVILRGPGAGTAGGLAVGVAEVEAAGVRVVLDQPGHAAYIPRNGAPPIGPFFISNKGLAKVQDELAPEVARASDGNGLLGALVPAAIGAVALGVLLSTGDDDGDNRAGQTGQAPQAGGNNNTANTPGKPR